MEILPRKRGRVHAETLPGMRARFDICDGRTCKHFIHSMAACSLDEWD